MSKKTRDIFLLGCLDDIKGSKLPSKGDALECFCYLHKEKKLTIREASTAVIEKIYKFWKRARIPLANKIKMIEKFEVLNQKYQLLKKGRSRRSAPQTTKENAFKDDLKNLFDVASSDALTIITNKEDLGFLLAQREPGRKGSMGGVDMVLACQEEQTEHRKQLQERCKQRAEDESFQSYASVELESSTSNSGREESCEDDDGTSGSVRPPSQKKAKKTTKNIVTSSLTGALIEQKFLTE